MKYITDEIALGEKTFKAVEATTDPNLANKTITENGTYLASDEGLEGYDEVEVDVPSTGNNFAKLVDKSVTTVTSDDLAGVTAIGDYAFYNCTSLVGISISNTVTNIGSYAFDGCTSLATITYNGTSVQWYSITKGTGWDNSTGDYVVICTDGVLDKQGVMYILSNNEYAVDRYFGSLTSITIKDTINGKNVTSIGDNAFDNNYTPTSVTIPDSVTSIGWYAFFECINLTSVDIGSGLTSIEDYAFSKCRSLTSITINATTPPSLSRANAFGGTYPIYVPAGSVSAYQSADVWSTLSSRIQAISA